MDFSSMAALLENGYKMRRKDWGVYEYLVAVDDKVLDEKKNLFLFAPSHFRAQDWETYKEPKKFVSFEQALLAIKNDSKKVFREKKSLLILTREDVFANDWIIETKEN